MLIEKYKGKNVKILAGSDSGAGIARATAGSGVTDSMVVICGKVVDIDEKYIELSSVQILRLTTCSLSADSFLKLENFNSTMVNQSKIISISIIEENATH